jgi:alpha-beta hydrolase superfamily lysophospholipase
MLPQICADAQQLTRTLANLTRQSCRGNFCHRALADNKRCRADQVHLFGHGFGALVANEFAKTNPAAVSSLIFASPPASLVKPTAKQVRSSFKRIAGTQG